jgi:hypothetical protein
VAADGLAENPLHLDATRLALVLTPCLGGSHPLAATWQGHALVVAAILGSAWILSIRKGGNITVGDNATLRF